MQTLIYLLAKSVAVCIQALPLRLVARLGRLGGSVVYCLDARHRKVALKNLTMCFGQEKSPREIVALARENFRRIGENFASAVKTAAMTNAQLKPHLEICVPDPIIDGFRKPREKRIVFAIGHFGNFELYARLPSVLPDVPGATTYRALRQPGLNRLLNELRSRPGCSFFERRTEGADLRTFMNQPRAIMGLLADQSAGGNRLRLRFLGHECSTSSAPAVFALRYDSDLAVAICYRLGLARWRVEMAETIPTHDSSGPRSVADLMTDVNRVFEAAVRRDPANWFWVHNRWKPVRQKAPVLESHEAESLEPEG